MYVDWKFELSYLVLKYRCWAELCSNWSRQDGSITLIYFHKHDSILISNNQTITILWLTHISQKQTINRSINQRVQHKQSVQQPKSISHHNQSVNQSNESINVNVLFVCWLKVWVILPCLNVSLLSGTVFLIEVAKMAQLH